MLGRDAADRAERDRGRDRDDPVRRRDPARSASERGRLGRSARRCRRRSRVHHFDRPVVGRLAAADRARPGRAGVRGRARRRPVSPTGPPSSHVPHQTTPPAASVAVPMPAARLAAASGARAPQVDDERDPERRRRLVLAHDDLAAARARRPVHEARRIAGRVRAHRAHGVAAAAHEQRRAARDPLVGHRLQHRVARRSAAARPRSAPATRPGSCACARRRRAAPTCGAAMRTDRNTPRRVADVRESRRRPAPRCATTTPGGSSDAHVDPRRASGEPDAQLERRRRRSRRSARPRVDARRAASATIGQTMPMTNNVNAKTPTATTACWPVAAPGGHAVRAEREQHDRREREIARTLVTGTAAAQRGAGPSTVRARGVAASLERGHGRAHPFGAATRSTISVITRPPAATSTPLASTMRCASDAGATAFTSSGDTKSRPMTVACACAARSRLEARARRRAERDAGMVPRRVGDVEHVVEDRVRAVHAAHRGHRRRRARRAS